MDATVRMLNSYTYINDKDSSVSIVNTAVIKVQRLALGPTQFPIQRVLGTLTPVDEGVKRLRNEADYSSTVPWLRINGATPPPPHIF
jgi:hypothetical protein